MEEKKKKKSRKKNKNIASTDVKDVPGTAAKGSLSIPLRDGRSYQENHDLPSMQDFSACDGVSVDVNEKATSSDAVEAAPLPNEKVEICTAEGSELVTYLKGSLASEVQTSELLRLRISALEEQIAARDVTETSMHAEIYRLREENARLLVEVSELRDKSGRQMQEQKQLLTKMAAMQTGLRQLEREAAVRSRVTDDLMIASSSESPKRWRAWGSIKESPGDIAALAEESRLQKDAAAVMIDKLVEENVELTRKFQINEMSLRLEQQNQHGQQVENMLMTTDQDITHLQEVIDPAQQESNSMEHSAEETKFVVIDGQQSGDGNFEIESCNLSLESSLTPTDEMHIKSTQNYDIQQPTNGNSTVAAGMKIEPVPFSDAPLMGAPIRMLRFVARFVSGADLVKTTSYG